MSKISPCLWFNGVPSRPQLLRFAAAGSKIGSVARNSTDGPRRQGRQPCWWWSSRWRVSNSWRSTAA